LKHIGAAHAHEAPRSSTLVQTPPTILSAVSPDLAVVCLFSLLGLTLTAAVLSYASPETIGMMFSVFG
jgi:hypothetical protein